MISVIHKIIKITEAFPERKAIHVNGQYYSYKEFTRIAKTIKELILHEKFCKNDPIGVLTGDDVYTYASILAILSTGAAYVPISKNNPQDRNATIINDANVNVILASKNHQLLDGLKNNTNHELKIINTNALAASDLDLDCPPIDDEKLCYLLFTSGSTGTPKGVPIYNKNLNKFIAINLESGLYDFCEEDRFLQMFQLTFDFSIMTFFIPLCVGACCYVVPDKGISYLNIVDYLERYKITVAPMVPSVLSYLERYFNELKFDTIRHSIFCGEPLPYKLAHAWSNCVPNAVIQNAYGPTEATVYCIAYNFSNNSADESVRGILPIGKPFPGMRVEIIDANKKPVAIGQEGELCLAGLQVTDQYWNDVDKTKDAFFKFDDHSDETFYRTGDRVFINDQGDYIHCGRIDYQVKIDGHRVELGEIEHIVRDYVGHSNVAAVMSSNKGNSESLMLYLIGDAATKQKLEEHLATKLAYYMIPREIIYLNELPHNLNGKIDRKKLSQL